MFIALRSSLFSPDSLHAVTPQLLTVTPRIVIGRNQLVWADARGLNAELVVRDLLALFDEREMARENHDRDREEQPRPDPGHTSRQRKRRSAWRRLRL